MDIVNRIKNTVTDKAMAKFVWHIMLALTAVSMMVLLIFMSSIEHLYEIVKTNRNILIFPFVSFVWLILFCMFVNSSGKRNKKF